MTISGITWESESIEDVEILSELPLELVQLLNERNGFILHQGAVHVRGACLGPEWHSLRSAWYGPNSFHLLYEAVEPTDIPFGQDQFGDQFLIRGGEIVRLSGETGGIEKLASTLEDFFRRADCEIEKFLNVSIDHKMEPGQLIFAYPPFCTQESGRLPALKAVPATELILIHAELAKQLKDLPDGGQIEFRLVD